MSINAQNSQRSIDDIQSRRYEPKGTQSIAENLMPFSDPDPDSDPCLIHNSSFQTTKYFKEEFDRRLGKKKCADKNEWYEMYLEICDYFGVEPMETERAMNLHHANECIEPSFVKPNPKPKHIEPQEDKQTSRAEVVDMTKTGTVSDEQYESLVSRKEATGMHLFHPSIPPEAWGLLKEINSMSAMDLYYRFTGNMGVTTGITHKKSRRQWAEELGISRATWARVEKQMHDKGLIEYHKDDVAHAWEQEVAFKLPHVEEWYNVRKSIEIYEKQEYATPLSRVKMK